MKRNHKFTAALLAITELTALTATSAFAFHWWWPNPSNSFVIEVDQSGDIVAQAGQAVQFTGNIRWAYAHSKSFRSPPSGILDRVDVKFYYPDLAHEVAAVLDQRRLKFSFATPTLEAGTSPVFTVIVGKLSPQVLELQRIAAKLQKRIDLVNAILNRYHHQNPRWKETEEAELRALINCLTRVNQKLAQALAQKQEVLAKREFPIQVGNGVASLARNQTLMGGVSFDLSFDRGVLIQGESTQGHVRLTNLRDRLSPETPFEIPCKKGDKFTVETHWNGALLTRKNQAFDPGAQYAFDFDTGKADPTKPNLVRVDLYKNDNDDWGRDRDRDDDHRHDYGSDRSKVLFGSLSLELPVARDAVAPVWLTQATPDSEHAYVRDPQALSATLQDSLGRIDPQTIRANLTGNSNDGEVVTQDLTSALLKSSVDDGASIQISHPLNLALEEGQYSVSAQGSDLAGNLSAVLTLPFQIDRTAPTLNLNQDLPELTANPAIPFSVSVTDRSPTTTRVLLNGSEILSTELMTAATVLTLSEGPNFIEVRSLDRAQNESTQTFGPVFLDRTPPILSIQKPINGATLASLSVAIQGSSNEALSSFTANGVSIPLSGSKTDFIGSISAPAEGSFQINLSAKDLVGNETTQTVSVFVTQKLLREGLISLAPDPEVQSGILVVGAMGAAYPNAVLTAKGGFLNSTQGTPNADGSFAFKLGFASRVTLDAFAQDLGRTDQVILNYQVDTRFSGLVMDTGKRPLPGVKVYFPSRTDVTPAFTDSSGAFVFNQPVSGDQTVIFDGSGLQDPCQDCGARRFNPVTIKVTLGLKQANTLVRTIYLTPEILDGNQVTITQTSGGVVTNPNAPGISLSVPAQAVGMTEVPISMSVIPSEVSMVELPSIGSSDTVINFEPSGLVFSKPVEVTVPNENDLPPGWDFILMSFDTKTGQWGPDGVAEVSDDGRVVRTKPGMGLTHFSQAFLQPTGPRIAQAGSQDRPGADSFDGALTVSIPMPSYKALGQDIAPSLTYKSSWAKPTVMVTNLFSLPQINITTYQEVANNKIFGFDFVSGGANIKIKDQVTKITSQFASGTLNSAVIEHKPPSDGFPEKSAISYSFDLGDFSTGIYPYTSAWEVHYRHTRVVTPVTFSRKYGLFGPMVPAYQAPQDQSFNQIYPSALNGSLYVQNRKNSEAGTGWRIGGYGKIINPSENKVFIEEGDGSISAYAVNNTISTVVDLSSANETRTLKEGVRIAWPNLLFTQKNDASRELPVRLDLSNGSTASASLGSIAPLVGNIVHNWTHVYTCGIFNKKCSEPARIQTNYTMKRRAGDYLLLPNGQILATVPKYHSVYLGSGAGGSDIGLLAGKFQIPPASSGGREAPDGALNAIQNNYCIAILGERCQSTSGRVTGWGGSAGSYPYPGISLPNTSPNSLSTLLLNTPKGLAVNPITGTVAVADYGNHRVLEINLSNSLVRVVAGNGQTTAKNDGVPATQSSVVNPTDLAYDRAGQLYVLTQEGRVRVVDVAGLIHTVGGLPSTDASAIYSDSTQASKASLKSPSGLALDENRGYLYVSDTGHNRVIAFDLTQNADRAFTVAGSATGGFSGDGGPALSAALSGPTALGIDPDGNLLIADAGNERVRRVVFQSSTLAKLSFSPVSEDFSKLERDPSTQTWVRTTRDGTKLNYNALGLCVQVVARNGRAVTYEFDAQNRIRSQIDPTGGRITYGYTGDLLTSITDAANRTTQFNYDGTFLKGVTYPDGTTRSYSYFSDGLLKSEINERGFATQYHYNIWNRLESVTRPDGTLLTVNDQGSVTASNSYTGGNQGELKSTTSDGYGNSITDGNQITTTFKKDDSGYISSIKDGQGMVTRFERNLKGQVTKVYFDYRDNRTPDDLTDDTYHSVTTYTYNEFGDRLTENDSETGITLTKTYNSFGQVLTESSPRGVIATHTYDAVTGLETSLRDTETGLLGNIEYNHPLKLVTKKINALGFFSTMQYDPRGNLLNEVNPIDAQTTAAQTYTRDNLTGNVLEFKNAKGEITKYEYDIWNRLKSVTTPKNEKTEYTYSETGKLLLVLDPEGNQISYTYNNLDQLEKTTDQRGKETLFAYDGNGNLAYKKDPNGHETRYTYNSRNDVIKKILPDDTLEVDYDPQGRLLGSRNAISEIALGYDFKKTKVESITSSGRGVRTDFPSVTLALTYDNFQSRKALSSPAGTTQYFYDNYGRVSFVTSPQGETFGFEYDALGREKKRTRPGSQSVFDYDQGNFLKSITHTGLGNLAVTQGYTRDLLGNRITSSRSGLANLSFLYDGDQQLTNVTSTNAVKLPNESFGYDAISNRTTDQGGSYAYDSTKQLLTEDYKNFYFYDDNGNLISKQAKGMTGEVTLFQYSSENQLMNVKVFAPGGPQSTLYVVGTSVPVKEISYAYDSLGRRIEKRVTDFAAQNDPKKSFTRQFFYDGQDLILEYDGQGQLLASYTHKLNLSDNVIDDPLSVSVTQAGADQGLAQTSGRYHYVKDGLGSVTEISDSSGNLVQRYLYSAFGLLLGIQDASAADITPAPKLETHYAFTGREYDSETGNYYYRARYYDPGVGRFLQKDSFAGSLDDVTSVINNYSYCSNQPGNLTDPSGRFIFIIAFVYAAATMSTATIGAAALTGAVLGALGYLGSIEASRGFSPTSTYDAFKEDSGKFFKGLGLSVLFGGVFGGLGKSLGSGINSALKIGEEAPGFSGFAASAISESTFSGFSSFGASLGQNLAFGDANPFENAFTAGGIGSLSGLGTGIFNKGLLRNRSAFRLIAIKREGLLFIGTNYVPYYEKK